MRSPKVVSCLFTVAFGLGVLLSVSCVCSAQTESATISGRVTDSSGAVIVKATVDLQSADKGTIIQTTTNDAGIYVFPSVHPGVFHITVRKDGFKTEDYVGLTANVQDHLEQNFRLVPGAISESITVTADQLNVNTADASVSTVIDRNFVESLPLNGRSFNTLLQLTPGVVIAPTTGSSPGQFSIAGQRTDANNFTVDGVSANFGVGSLVSFGGSGTGAAQAFSVLGGTSSLVSVEALQEFRIETSSFAPEFGRSPGGQVILNTRPGTNAFHGGVYDYFRNTVMDANNWFNDAASPPIPKAPEHHNDFGGFLGGPIWKDKTFFFASYEGARLQQPRTILAEVPSEFARTQASASLAPFLNAYPQPNGQPTSPTAFTAPFTGNYSNAATLDAGSIRFDHTFNSRFSIFGRYNNAPSSIVAPDLSTLQMTTTNTQTLTLGLNIQVSSQILNVLRGNYSTQDAATVFAMDTAGGAKPLDPNLLLGTLPAATTFLGFETYDTAFYAMGTDAANHTKQFNIADDLSWSLGRHQLKFGGDYRAIFLDARPFQNELIVEATSVQDFLSSTGHVPLFAQTINPSQFLIQALSLYGQDSWKVSPRLSLTYGVRWELSPAPSARSTTTLASWTNINNPAELGLASPGTPLWGTTYGNFAPRLGVAYSLNEKGDFVVRAGGGVFYDLGVGQAAQLGAAFPNSASSFNFDVPLPLADATPFLPVLSRQPPFPSGAVGYSPSLKLPRSYQWNVGLEKRFGGSQAISVTYAGQAGRDLLREEALYQPNSNFLGDFLLWVEDARSNYNALQLQYRRPLASGLQALLNYTWSHSLDNASNDSIVGLSNAIISAANDYASSDFDVRQSFSGALTYAIPGVSHYEPVSLITRDWSIDTVIVARTGFPFNALSLFSSPDPGGYATSRPDLVPGQPLWIPNPQAGGGKSMNPAAFSIPSSPRQGTEGRNDIPGFGLTQVDLSIGRSFPFTERVKLQFRADAFNVLNHPNFTNPYAYVGLGPSFLQSPSMLNQGLGGLNPLFQEGGPRSLQLSLKLTF